MAKWGQKHYLTEWEYCKKVEKYNKIFKKYFNGKIWEKQLLKLKKKEV